MSKDDDQKKWTAPEGAYRPKVAYDSSTDVFPREIEYENYRKLGLVRNTGQSARAAQAEARLKFGPRTLVFQTAKFWVAYAVD